MRRPKVAGEMSQAFERQILLPQVVECLCAQHEQRTDQHYACATCLHVRHRAADGRSRVDDVVDDRDVFASQPLTHDGWDAVPYRVHAGALVPDKPLGVVEVHIKLGGDGLGDHGAANEGPADRSNAVWPNPARQDYGEASNLACPNQRPVQVEPQVAVMAGFKLEVAFAR